MNFKFLTCRESASERPKSNVTNRKSVKKKSSKHKKSSSSHNKRRVKSSYKSSSLFSKNFYPANYFFQDDYRTRLHDTRVGVNDQNGFMITTRNPPQLPLQTSMMMPRKNLPSSSALLQQQQKFYQHHHYLPMKVGFYG